MLDYMPEFGLGDQRVEDLGVKVRVGGGEVAGDHPVAFDADDARGGVFWAGEGDVGV